MVRPGFYLGRAYAGKVFLLNFVLYNKAIAERDGPAFAKTGSRRRGLLDRHAGARPTTLAAK